MDALRQEAIRRGILPDMPTAPVTRQDGGGYAPPKQDHGGFLGQLNLGKIKTQPVSAPEPKSGFVDTAKRIGTALQGRGYSLTPNVLELGKMATEEGRKGLVKDQVAQVAFDTIAEVDTLDETSKWSEIIKSFSLNPTPEQEEKAQIARFRLNKAYDQAFREKQLGRLGEDAAGNPYLITNSGEHIPLDSIVDSLQGALKANKGVAAGAMAGAHAGWKYNPHPNPIIKGLTSLAGGAIGSFGGSVGDTALNAWQTGREFDKRFALEKATQEAVADPILTLGTAGALKYGGKYVAKGAEKLRNATLGRNLGGAEKLARDAEVDIGAIHAERSRFEDTPQKGEGWINKTADTIMPGVAKTQDELASAAMSRITLWNEVAPEVAGDMVAKTRTLDSITKRATKLEELASKGASTEVEIRQNIEAFENEVKKSYSEMVDGLHTLFPDFRANVDEVQRTLTDAIENVLGTETDAQLKKLLDIVTKDNRAFSVEDLFALRKKVNKIKTDNFEDLQVIRQLNENLNDQIARAIDTHPDPAFAQQLKDAFAQNRARYAQMFKMQDSKAYKDIMKEEADDKAVADALIKHARSIEGTLNDVTKHLSPEQRAGAEMRAITGLFERFMTEAADGKSKALDFQGLVKVLNKVHVENLQSENAKNLIQIIREMDGKFGLDSKMLIDLSGGSIKKLSEGIAQDVLSRLETARANLLTKMVIMYLPIQAGRSAAFKHHVLQSLRKARTPRDFIKFAEEFPDTPPALWAKLKPLVKEYEALVEQERIAKFEAQEQARIAKEQAEQLAKEERLAKEVAEKQALEQEVANFKTPSKAEARAVDALTKDDQYYTFSQLTTRIADGTASKTDIEKYIKAKRKIGDEKITQEIERVAALKQLADGEKELVEANRENLMSLAGKSTKERGVSNADIQRNMDSEDMANQAYRDRFKGSDDVEHGYFDEATVHRALDGDEVAIREVADGLKQAQEEGHQIKTADDLIREIADIGKQPETPRQPAKTPIEGTATAKESGDSFAMLQKEASIEKEIPSHQRYTPNTTTDGKEISDKVFPAFQGNKKEMSRFAHALIRDHMPVETRNGITIIDDNFGGSGSWNIYLASTDLFPNLKKIRINEFDAERLNRIKILHNKQGVVSGYLDKNMGKLQYEFDNMLSSRQVKYGNNSLTGDVAKNASGGSFKNRLIELAHKEQDEEAKAALKFMADIIGRGVKSNDLKRQLYRIASQADDIAQQVGALKKKGVEFDYVNSSAFDLDREKGSHVLTLYDPPYYGTAGYDIVIDTKGRAKNKNTKVELWMYDLIEKDIQKLSDLDHNILYTDENWWTKVAKNGESNLPQDMSQQIGGTNAIQKRDSISENFTLYNDSIPIAQRREILALRIANGSNAGNERLLQQSNRGTKKTGHNAKIRPQDGNNGRPVDGRGMGNGGQHSGTTLDSRTQGKNRDDSGARDSASDRTVNDFLRNLVKKEDYVNQKLQVAASEDAPIEYPSMNGQTLPKQDKQGNLRDPYTGKVIFSIEEMMKTLSKPKPTTDKDKQVIDFLKSLGL